MGGIPSKTFNPVEDLPSIAGKVVIVTGSSRDIGFATLQYLSRMGAKVYMAARNETRAKEAIDRLNEEGRETGFGEVIWHELDLTDPRSAKESTERFISRERKLDILVNNAALSDIIVFIHPCSRFMVRSRIPAFGNVQVLNADDIEESMAIKFAFLLTFY
ncbi:hypothetical protein EDD85DRAFT_361073 [Armillaria nabsnona]|nr:hypothetical protein EDD85DRAFT_361073 [Armillaria nabsnona]